MLKQTKTSTDTGSCWNWTYKVSIQYPAIGLLIINSYIRSECNLNLLEEANYFLKLIAIFVDLAWLFGGKGKEAEKRLLGSVVKNLYF